MRVADVAASRVDGRDGVIGHGDVPRGETVGDGRERELLEGGIDAAREGADGRRARGGSTAAAVTILGGVTEEDESPRGRDTAGGGLTEPVDIETTGALPLEG